MMELRLGNSGKKHVEDEPTKGNLAGGCCFDFNKVSYWQQISNTTATVQLSCETLDGVTLSD